MFISINHIPVAKGRENDFEELFRKRDRAIESMEGFISIDILKPSSKMFHGEPSIVDENNEYQVLTRWSDESAFKRWLESDEFKKAHSKPTDRSIFQGKSFLTLHKTVE